MVFTQAVWWVMLVTGIVVFLAAVYLAFLNWNENLAATTTSVFLGGAVTLLIAVIAGLKASTVSDRFISAVVLDAEGLPVWFGSGSLPPPPDQMMSLLSGLRSIAGDHSFPPSDPNSAARQRHAAMLLQCYLLKTLAGMGPEAGAKTQVSRTIAVTPRSAIRCRLRDVSPEEIGDLASNPFAAAEREKQVLDRVPVKIPEHARVVLSNDQAPSVVFDRPGYFKFSVTIRPLGDATRVLPKGFEYLQNHASECHSVPCLIELDARFEKYTAGSKYTFDVRSWVQAIFERFRQEAGTQSQ